MNETTSLSSGVIVSGFRDGGLLRLNDGGLFMYADSPSVCQRAKRVCFGSYKPPTRESSVPAVLTVFSDAASFEREWIRHAMMDEIGVGPSLLAQGTFADSSSRSSSSTGSSTEGSMAIIQEDAGISLDALLAGEVEEIPNLWGNERGAHFRWCNVQQAAKIVFDIACELTALHSRGWRYLDLKTANVCVQAYGGRSGEVRASLIDFESAVPSETIQPRVITPEYWHAARRLAKSQGVSFAHMGNLRVDLTLLTLLAAQLLSGKRNPGDLDVEDLVLAERQGLAFCMPWSRVCRPLDSARLHSLGILAGLSPVGKNDSAEDRLAANLAGHAGFLDGIDRKRSRENPRVILEERVLDLALSLHGGYNRVKATDSRRLDELESFLDQPVIKVKQGLRQARDAYELLQECGYEVVCVENAPGTMRLTAIPDDVVEYIAELEHASWMSCHLSAGYRYGATTDDAILTNRFLLPWDQLDEQDRRYDLEYARSLPKVLSDIGLAIVEAGYETDGLI